MTFQLYSVARRLWQNAAPVNQRRGRIRVKRRIIDYLDKLTKGMVDHLW